MKNISKYHFKALKFLPECAILELLQKSVFRLRKEREYV